MKKSLKFIALGLTLGISVPAFIGTFKVNSAAGYSASSLPTTIDLNDTSASNIRSYYSSLNNLSQSERQGTNLLKNLKTILKNGQKYYSYESGENVWKMYEITDRDWDKSPASAISGYNSSTKKITGYSYNSSDPYLHALYVNRDVNNQTTAWSDHQQTQWGINREHVWPKAEGFDSSGAGGARGDPRHLMAGNGYANNIHSNYYYGYVKSSGATDCGSKYSNLSGNLKGTSQYANTGTVFEPQDSDKGDIARSIFYMVARYNYLSGSDSDGIDANNPNLTLTQNISDWSSSGYTSTTSNPGKLGILTDLLAWHHADPVDEYEIHRNNLLYTNFTNNRNPFVDFPEWVDFIWGTATYNGKQYQSYSSTPTGYATPSSDTINGYNGGSSDPVSVTGVSVSPTSTSIQVGSSELLSATVSPNNATNQNVTWTSSNTNVATVSSSGRVEAVAEGNATITVTTSDGGFTATCTVTVTASGGGGGGGTPAVDKLMAKGFGGYTTSSYSAAGTDYTGVANLTNSSGATYALQVFNGSNGQVRGNQSTGSANFSARNTTTYSGYYVSEVSLTVDDGGTLDGGTADRSVVWFGSSAYANPTTAPSAGIKVSATPASSGQQTLTWSNSNTSYNYFILYNLKAASAPKSKDADTPLTVTWSPVSSSTKTLDSITLDTSDAPTTFNVGDTFSYEGLSVTAYYDDGTDDIVTPTNVSTPNMSTAGQKTVTVTYTEDGVTKTAQYTITVNAVTLTSIEVSEPKTAYYVGDTFVKPTVTATYSNGSTSDVTNSATFSGYNLSNAGNQTVTVSYTNGTTQTTSYNITVTAVAVTSISVSGQTTSFDVGDTFSFGGTVTAHYNNGSSADVTASATFSGYNMSTAGNQTVTVSYGGQTTTYEITVTDPSAGPTASVIIQNYATANSWVNSTKYTSVQIDSVATASVGTSGSNSGKYYTSGYEWRFYQTESATIVISVLEGYTIDSVAITYGISNTGILKDSSQNTVVSGETQIVNAQSVTYSVANSGSATNGQVKITAISITYHSNSSDPVTSISATVSKTYHPGETIVAGDVTVKDNNLNIVSTFTLVNAGYQFTYEDAPSGGTAGTKQFTVTASPAGEQLSCTLSVNVSRINFATTSSTSLTPSNVFKDIGGSNNNLQSGTVEKEGITYEYSKAYYYSGGSALSFGNASSITGYLINETPLVFPIKDVTVVSSGRTVNIRYSTDGNTWVLKSSATTDTTDYRYFKLDCSGYSGSSYSNITNITVSYNSTATNTANYIMYEDTANQCLSKYTTAKAYFNSLPSYGKTSFMTSNDYVIATARERFEAWARYNGETITYSNGTYSISRIQPINVVGNKVSSDSVALIVIISILGIGVVGGYFYLRKKKHE